MQYLYISVFLTLIFPSAAVVCTEYNPDCDVYFYPVPEHSYLPLHQFQMQIHKSFSADSFVQLFDKLFCTVGILFAMSPNMKICFFTHSLQHFNPLDPKGRYISPKYIEL